MTQKLDPEIKALRAINRALCSIDLEAQDRVVAWASSLVGAKQRRSAFSLATPDPLPAPSKDENTS